MVNFCQHVPKPVGSYTRDFIVPQTSYERKIISFEMNTSKHNEGTLVYTVYVVNVFYFSDRFRLIT